jgi:acyl CoA:acetate/3-ketoacid CoA transferase alpha subunit
MSDTLLGALAKRKDVKDIVGVSNNSGGGDSGLGELLKYTVVEQYLTTLEDKLINTNQLSKIIASYPGRSSLYSYTSKHRVLNYAISWNVVIRTSKLGFLVGKLLSN